MLLLLLLPTAAPYRFIPEREILPYAYLSYNSNPVVDINDVPHHVVIVYGSRYCSGSLIGSKVVITAASCLGKRKNEPVVVKVGSNTITGNGQIIPVLECKIHEYYKHLSSLDNDIALLMLKEHVLFGKNVVKTILVEPEIALRVGAQVIVTGWGGLDLPDKYLNLLLRSEMLIIDRRACQTYYGELITPSNYCVKYNLEHRLSDNGGGAIFEELLVGVLSSGTDRKQGNNLAILTNVSYFHRQSTKKWRLEMRDRLFFLQHILLTQEYPNYEYISLNTQSARFIRSYARHDTQHYNKSSSTKTLEYFSHPTFETFAF